MPTKKELSEKVIFLKNLYSSVYGKPPKGAKCNDVTWLQSKIDEVSTESTQKRDREEDVEEETASKNTKKQKAFNNLFELLLKEVTDILTNRRQEQIDHAKSNNMPFDPCVTSNTNPTLHDLCLIGLGSNAFDDIVDTLVRSFSKMKSPTALDDYCLAYAKELDGISNHFKDGENGEITSLIFRYQSFVSTGSCKLLSQPLCSFC
jgi:hypothetical protein